MIIDKVECLSSKHARFRIHLSTYEYYDIGEKNIKTYIDGASEEVKQMYWNKNWNKYAENLFLSCFIPSKALFTCYLLWGKYRNIYENTKWLNDMLSKISYTPQNVTLCSKYINTYDVYTFYKNTQSD